jgi:hypothetical protein
MASETVKALRAARKKLNDYVDGLPKGSVETPKYLELNAKVNALLKKVPWIYR